jgi:hypothetical protein
MLGETGNMNMLELITSIFAVVGQTVVLYLVRKMIKFATKYGKPWAWAFRIYFAAMLLCWFRRVAVLLWTFGMDGGFKEAVIWYDRYVSNPILTIMYLGFLIILVMWWKKFFKTYIPCPPATGLDKKE